MTLHMTKATDWLCREGFQDYETHPWRTSTHLHHTQNIQIVSKMDNHKLMAEIYVLLDKLEIILVVIWRHWRHDGKIL